MPLTDWILTGGSPCQGILQMATFRPSSATKLHSAGTGRRRTSGGVGRGRGGRRHCAPGGSPRWRGRGRPGNRCGAAPRPPAGRSGAQSGRVVFGELQRLPHHEEVGQQDERGMTVPALHIRIGRNLYGSPVVSQYGQCDSLHRLELSESAHRPGLRSPNTMHRPIPRTYRPTQRAAHMARRAARVSALCQVSLTASRLCSSTQQGSSVGSPPVSPARDCLLSSAAT